MGKRIIVQARGKGSHTYRVKKSAFKHALKYSREITGEGLVVKLINSAGHSAPIAKIAHSKGSFFMPAAKNMFEGQKISIEDNKVADGNILKLKNIPVKTSIYNIESRPKDGGKFIKTGGSHATISRIIGNDVFVLMPSKKEKIFNAECRATIGVAAGAGRLDKPVLKAGKQHFIKKSKNKLFPRTSAVCMNVIDHPFGSGRAKNPKPKIAKRNAPPGARVGLIRPRRTGKRK